jgi:hypothetical protein
MKGAVEPETLDAKELARYGALCAKALAAGHARSGNSAAIAAYLGDGGSFDTRLVDFAMAYADQNELDYHAFVEAILSARLPAIENL